MYQSIPSTNIPPGQTSGKFLEVVESPATGQKFSAKARPSKRIVPTHGEYFRRSRSLPINIV